MLSPHNAYFRTSDPCANRLMGYEIYPEWWSRQYEYPWAMQYAGQGMNVADMGCGYEHRPFKDMLSKVCDKVFAVDHHQDVLKLPRQPNMEFIVADFASRIDIIPDESLDRVFCISVLEELSLSRITSALAEFHRILKPDGLCVFTCDVQYDYGKPPGVAGRGVDLDELFIAIYRTNFQYYGDVDFKTNNRMYDEGFNLCVFHGVLQ